VLYRKKGDLREQNRGRQKNTKREPLKLKIFILGKTAKKKPPTLLNCIQIKKDMGWCNDIRYKKKYNKLFKIEKKIKHEKLKRKDYKYDFLIPIKYNFNKTITGRGSCIFIHLTRRL
jgi:L,D-peptidoglycan transpeptidase YkuD (ErfK/YbiS/YcfS/YnhG family)